MVEIRGSVRIPLGSFLEPPSFISSDTEAITSALKFPQLSPEIITNFFIRAYLGMSLGELLNFQRPAFCHHRRVSVGSRAGLMCPLALEYSAVQLSERTVCSDNSHAQLKYISTSSYALGASWRRFRIYACEAQVAMYRE